MKKRLWTLAVTTAFVVTACTQRATAITIHTIGDSTMSHYDQDVHFSDIIKYTLQKCEIISKYTL